MKAILLLLLIVISCEIHKKKQKQKQTKLQTYKTTHNYAKRNLRNHMKSQRTGGWYDVEPSELQPELLQKIAEKLQIDSRVIPKTIRSAKCQVIAGLRCQVHLKAGGESFQIELKMDPQRQVSILE